MCRRTRRECSKRFRLGGSIEPRRRRCKFDFHGLCSAGQSNDTSFDTGSKKIVSLNVNTYMGQAKDAVTLQVQMASLPDGTNYAQRTVLNATAKELVVTTTKLKIPKALRGIFEEDKDAKTNHGVPSGSPRW